MITLDLLSTMSPLALTAWACAALALVPLAMTLVTCLAALGAAF